LRLEFGDLGAQLRKLSLRVITLRVAGLRVTGLRFAGLRVAALIAVLGSQGSSSAGTRAAVRSRRRKPGSVPTGRSDAPCPGPVAGISPSPGDLSAA
jgi:hypothetical protein